MSNKLDVDDLINWLNQSEDEAKATVAESGATADPFYDGVLSAIFQIREYIKKMRKIDDAEGKSEKQWISVDENFRKILAEDTSCVWWRTTWKIHRCFASTKKNMDLAFGKIYMIR